MRITEIVKYIMHLAHDCEMSGYFGYERTLHRLTIFPGRGSLKMLKVTVEAFEHADKASKSDLNC